VDRTGISTDNNRGPSQQDGQLFNIGWRSQDGGTVGAGNDRLCPVDFSRPPGDDNLHCPGCHPLRQITQDTRTQYL
jgi:hypothetical protein